MSLAAPSSYDKTIVERRRPQRNVELAKVLQGARERLTSRRGLLPRFDRELLIQHALAVRMAAATMPLPLFLTSFGLSTFVGMNTAVAWGAVAMACYIFLFALTKRFSEIGPTEFDSQLWRRVFLGGHAAAGLGWAVFAGLDCADCGPLRFEVFQFSTLLLAVALTAMVSFTLRSVVAVAFAPLVLVLAYRMIGTADPVAMAMDAIIVGAVPFFALVAEHLRRIAAERLTHQAEKDELIAELDTARIISEEARHRAEEANLAKSRFLATMSHELRTPLNAILGFSEVISNEILGPVGNPTYKDYVGDIHSSGQHLLNLINEILDLSRVEAGRYTLNEEAVELTRLGRECLGLVQLKAQAKEIKLQAQFEQNLPQLWADERSVRQIILNLLSNAVKFTPPGGEIVIKVGWTAGGGQYVGVFDNGPGIPEEEIPIVLSSFGQGTIAIKSAEQGAGLGLPIVQALMEMHDGEFVLTSKLRVGTQALAIFPHARVLEVMHAFQGED
ncbi:MULTISPECIES: ATP-binding protein [unclassified Aureimonas]|uniref:ATP-binding protein n=1 Tax=unclassified Aureimonas TaxID=2615206 RepID=UPI0006F96619|nr:MULTISPECIES: ATP-binding protein [unclassified Aureimonas]KQT57325.1 histidine kinase [Aureimonas sp. Leaf427]KQT77005.1 histidine kinase [Aureimonas sp. Leaf460]